MTAGGVASPPLVKTGSQQMHKVFVVETYDWEGETCLHNFWYSSYQEARADAEKLLLENVDDVLGYNIYELKAK